MKYVDKHDDHHNMASTLKRIVPVFQISICLVKSIQPRSTPFGVLFQCFTNEGFRVNLSMLKRHLHYVGLSFNLNDNNRME